MPERKMTSILAKVSLGLGALALGLSPPENVSAQEITFKQVCRLDRQTGMFIPVVIIRSGDRILQRTLEPGVETTWSLNVLFQQLHLPPSTRDGRLVVTARDCPIQNA